MCYTCSEVAHVVLMQWCVVHNVPYVWDFFHARYNYIVIIIFGKISRKKFKILLLVRTYVISMENIKNAISIGAVRTEPTDNSGEIHSVLAQVKESIRCLWRGYLERGFPSLQNSMVHKINEALEHSWDGHQECLWEKEWCSWAGTQAAQGSRHHWLAPLKPD